MVAVKEFPLFDQPVEVKAIHAQRVVESGGELYEAGGDRPFKFDINNKHDDDGDCEGKESGEVVVGEVWIGCVVITNKLNRL